MVLLWLVKNKQDLTKFKKRLSSLSAKFSNNVLDAVKSWEMVLTKKEVDGLTDAALAQFSKLQ